MKTIDYPIYSAVTYVNEPADLWQKKLEEDFKALVPSVVTRDKTQQWVIKGEVLFSDAGITEETVAYTEPLTADAYKQKLAQDGIAGAVLYPTITRLGYKYLKQEVLSQVIRAYNDWIIEFCQSQSQSLKAIAMLNTDDPQEAAEELKRTAQMGAVGAIIPLSNSGKNRYDQAQYEVIWQTAEALNIPLSILPGTLRTFTQRPFGLRPFNRDDWLGKFVHQTCSALHLRMCLASIILSGVFDRYPKLRVVTVGFGANWIPYFLTRTDEMYEVRPERMGPDNSKARYSEQYETYEMAQERAGFSLPEGVKPSDRFLSNIYVAFKDDLIGFELSRVMGIKNIVWGSAYPQKESTFPNSKEFLQSKLATMTEAEKAAIIRENAALLYGFPSGASQIKLAS